MIIMIVRRRRRKLLPAPTHTQTRTTSKQLKNTNKAHLPYNHLQKTIGTVLRESWERKADSEILYWKQFSIKCFTGFHKLRNFKNITICCLVMGRRYPILWFHDLLLLRIVISLKYYVRQDTFPQPRLVHPVMSEMTLVFIHIWQNTNI